MFSFIFRYDEMLQCQEMKTLKNRTTIFIIFITEVSLVSGFLVIIRILHGDNYLIVLFCVRLYRKTANCEEIGIECYLTCTLTG